MLRHRTMRARGFTLVELSVAMGVLALLLLAALPSMGEWTRNVRVRNTAESIQNGLQKARAEALRTNRNVGFWIVSQSDNRVVDNNCALSSSSGSWVISVADPSGLCATAPDPNIAPMIVETHAASDGSSSDVTVTAVDSGAIPAQRVLFDGFGRLTSAAGQIARIDMTHPLGARALRVVVSSGGGVRMCDPNVSAPDPRVCP